MTTREPVFRNASNGTGANCVDCGLGDSAVVVRDSKHCDGPYGTYPTLNVPLAPWLRFTDELKTGVFDRK